MVAIHFKTFYIDKVVDVVNQNKLI